MKNIALVFAFAFGLSGCMSIQESTPLTGSVAAKGLVIKRELPSPMASRAAAVPGTQFILVSAESAVVALADFANPIPFIGGMAKEALNRHAADGYKSGYAQLDPYTIATEKMAGSPLVSQRPDALPLKPVVYMVEGPENRWRMSLAFRIDGKEWVGRYMYHLPTTFPPNELKAAAPATLETLRRELETGSDILRQLIERDASGKLKGDGTRVEFGSYHVVGSNMLGVLPAKLVHFKDAELIEEGESYVILRSKGDLHADATESALAFGVHYFRKDQLHDFVKTAAR